MIVYLVYEAQHLIGVWTTRMRAERYRESVKTRRTYIVEATADYPLGEPMPVQPKRMRR